MTGWQAAARTGQPDPACAEGSQTRWRTARPSLWATHHREARLGSDPSEQPSEFPDVRVAAREYDADAGATDIDLALEYCCRAQCSSGLDYEL